jgi:diketogulonate reductase-like aldo/keto reductase
MATTKTLLSTLVMLLGGWQMLLLSCSLMMILIPSTTTTTTTTLIEAKSLFSSFTGGKNNNDNDEDIMGDMPATTLSNRVKFPLSGLGVGNLQPDLVEQMVSEGLHADRRTRLIDTAHASHNEKAVAKGIVSGVKHFLDTKYGDGGAGVRKKQQPQHHKVQVHVVTKIWYTYLGYERTKLSVQESLDALEEAILDESVDLKVHFLLHWPRCYSGISWMNCEGEEQDLPEDVKRVGPPPHLDKDNAWKQSWKALEDMYQSGAYPELASIGVSNFSGDDLEELIALAKVQPHILQMNVWSLLNDPHLVDLCNRDGIHMQVYNVMNGIVNQERKAPHAHHHLLLVANVITKSELSASMDQGTELDQAPVTAAEVVLKWLTQMGISVIPRTSHISRLGENSAVSLARIPPLSDEHLETVAQAMEALLSGTDLDKDVHVNVTFHAKNNDMFLYWFNSDGTEKQISYIGKGESFQESTHPKHLFRIYNAYNPEIYHDYTVTGTYGDHDHVHVEL